MRWLFALTHNPETEDGFIERLRTLDVAHIQSDMPGGEGGWFRTAQITHEFSIPSYITIKVLYKGLYQDCHNLSRGILTVIMNCDGQGKFILMVGDASPAGFRQYGDNATGATYGPD
jgi:hypothetical protein